MFTRPLALLLLAAIPLAACNREETPSAATTAPASTRPMDQAAAHLKAAGEELKQAADEAAQQAKPAAERAANEAREAVHKAAEKIAESTSQPATTNP